MAAIDLSDYKVTSEVHVFSEGVPSDETQHEVTSFFKFTLPDEFVVPAEVKEEDVEDDGPKTDEDGDMIVKRKNQTSKDYNLVIKHEIHTSLDLVGLQVWRGALLLGDFLLHSCTNDPQSHFKIDERDSIVELGAGTGMSSVVAGMVAGKVTSTDISSGNILLLIRNNCDLNAAWIKGDVSVHELNFYDDNYPDELVARIESSNVIIAADVIYHDDLSDAFIRSLKRIMTMGVAKTAFISMEKRYVFTISNLDAEAPCFEYFYEELVRIMSCSYSIQQLDISQIPQYFCYERAKELVLFKIERK